MKRNLSNKELEIISGGFLEREANGSYSVTVRTVYGFEVRANFKDDFYSAVEYDWKNFKELYKEMGINCLEALVFYYKYGRI